jgi:hypothetical protein
VSTADTALLVAVAASGLAVLLLLLVVYLLVVVRRIRKSQRRIIGSRDQDVVEFAVGLLSRLERLESRASTLESALDALSTRLGRCYQRRSLVRYDALDGSGAKQSATLALMDAAGSGVVISAIQGRDYARIYVKRVEEGKTDMELSPEEERALEQASNAS